MITIEFLRSFRIAGYALFDLTVSFLGIYLLSPLLSRLFLKLKIRVSRTSWLFFTLPSSIIIHLLVGTMTQMTRDFIDIRGHFILKVVIFGLAIIGLKGVKYAKKK